MFDLDTQLEINVMLWFVATHMYLKAKFPKTIFLLPTQKATGFLVCSILFFYDSYDAGSWLVIYQWGLEFNTLCHTLSVYLTVNIGSQVGEHFLCHLHIPPFPPSLILTRQGKNSMLHITCFNLSALSFLSYSKGSLPSNDSKASLISKTCLLTKEAERKFWKWENWEGHCWWLI